MILEVFKEAVEIIKLCQELNVRLTICSKSPNPVAGRGILTAIGLWEHFWNPQIFSNTKTEHMRHLVEADPGISYRDILFFDDCSVNIRECAGLGVTAHHVDGRYGLTWSDFHRGLKQHQSNSRSTKITNYFRSSRSTSKRVKEQVIITEIDAAASEEKDEEARAIAAGYDQDNAGDL
jgi:hypothetical protein